MKIEDPRYETKQIEKPFSPMLLSTNPTISGYFEDNKDFLHECVNFGKANPGKFISAVYPYLSHELKQEWFSVSVSIILYSAANYTIFEFAKKVQIFAFSNLILDFLFNMYTLAIFEEISDFKIDSSLSNEFWHMI